MSNEADGCYERRYQPDVGMNPRDAKRRKEAAFVGGAKRREGSNLRQAGWLRSESESESESER